MASKGDTRLGTVSFVTMGCAKNEVDSDHMSARLARAGYDVIDDAERADVIIVNTCSFIQAATEESIDAVLEVAGFESVREGGAHIIVAGCMPARYGDELAAEFPEVSQFLPCASEESVVNVVDGLLGVERLAGDDVCVKMDHEESKRISAYVKISDGCDRFCSYCSIPYIRGRYHSYSVEEIHSEVARVVGLGAREVVLIAQDTGRWGRDFDEPSSLADLMDNIARTWPDTWFRVMYIQPEGITDDLLAVVAEHDNICSYFDIPFQHVNQRILKDMNRRGSAEQYSQLIKRIQTVLPDAALRTTLIAGFPGETDVEFDELCEFVEETPFDYIGVFPYSREEGTRAYDLPDQVDEDEKLSRAQTLRDLADAVCSARIAERIGSHERVLICGFEEDGQLFGRSMLQAPDVDGVTYVDSGEPGEIVEVVIDDTLLYEVEGTVVQ